MPLFFKYITPLSSLSVFFWSITTLNALSANYEEHAIRSSKNDLMFLVRFDKNTSQPFSSSEITIVKESFAYWANILTPASGSKPGIISLQKLASPRMTAHNTIIPQGIFNALMNTGLQKAGTQSAIDLSQEDYSIPPDHKKLDLYTTLVHEIAHGLMQSPTTRLSSTLKFKDVLTPFQQGLVNHQNKAPQPKQKICSKPVCVADEFQVKNGLWFAGPAVTMVLKIKGLADLKGIPINPDDIQHLELKQSLMSHQNYRNYDRLMEAELALLKDIGWNINLCDYYGYSLYGDNIILTNLQGYGAINLDDSYSTINPNNTAYATGLHIYGSSNTVTQKAHLLSEGKHFVGIRVDGEKNTLIIPADIKIHASGPRGVGVRFAYGTDHVLDHSGSIDASEIGLSFDFGHNTIGDEEELRGSYMIEGYSQPNADLLKNLSNPLAKEVTIRGGIIGGEKAIYMSRTGYVEKITVTPKALISGDIVSEYKPISAPFLQGFTNLYFGPQTGDSSDPNAKFIYNHNIQGKNLLVTFTGSYNALYQGDHKVYSVEIKPGAMLVGDSTFTLDYRGSDAFYNEGVLSPSREESGLTVPNPEIGTITIDGHYRQSPTGKLVIHMRKNGLSDELHAKSANIQGTLEVRPEETFYENGWQRTYTFLTVTDSISGQFDHTILTQSPTLQLSMSTAKAQNGKSYAATLSKDGDKDIKNPHKIIIPPGSSPMPKVRRDGLYTCLLTTSPLFCLVIEPFIKKSIQHRIHNRPLRQAFLARVAHQSSENLSDLSPEETQETLEKEVQELENYEHQDLSLSSSEETEVGFAEKTPEKDEETFVITRAPHAYSQYGSTDNARQVGTVLDRLVDAATTEPLQNLYAALDWSAPDGSDVRSALAQLAPTAYGGIFFASLEREQQISDTLNARPYTPSAPGHWYVFALPFAGQLNQKNQGDHIGYSAQNRGLVVGAEHNSTNIHGLTLGFHAVAGLQTPISLKTPDNAQGHLQAGGVGLQAHYRPNNQNGLFLDGQIRLGLESGELARTLTIGTTYAAQQQSSWLGWTNVARLFGGYLWSLTTQVSLGPLAGVTYTRISHPTIQETGPSPLNQDLAATALNSVASSLGVRSIVTVTHRLNMDIQARWDRLLAGQTLTQDSSFVGYADSAFVTQTGAGPRDAFNLAGQATYAVRQNISLGARVGAQFEQGQKPQLAANLIFAARF